MRQKLRHSAPLFLGGGVLLFLLDVLTLVYRVLGLDKGTALYLALLTFLVAGLLVTRRYVHNREPNSPHDSE